MSANEIPKFCVNCVHAFQKYPPHGEWSCNASIPKHDLVTGETIWQFANLMRYEGNQCGPDAKLFELKSELKPCP